MGEVATPTYEGVLAELQTVREHGLSKLRRLHLPQLHAAARLTDLTDGETVEPAAVEALLRQAIDALGGGTEGEAAEYTFGLIQGTKLLPAPERRKRAAGVYNLSVDRFRKAYEPTLIEQVAEGVLARCHEARLRQTRLNMERRHPADSRLAVQWVERFEAYYRIWTPVYALAADLEAAISTRREKPADHPPWDPDSTEAYDPEDQANGYARYALYHYAQYLLELKRFQTKHGGLWLLSDADVEQQAADAIYRIGWHNPMNEDDDSWLRRFLADARHEEPQHFSAVLRATRTGAQTLDEWQAFVASCLCPDVEVGQPGCQVHSTIGACRDFCLAVDEDWTKIADWYKQGPGPIHGVEPRQLYKEHVELTSERGSDE